MSSPQNFTCFNINLTTWSTLTLYFENSTFGVVIMWSGRVRHVVLDMVQVTEWTRGVWRPFRPDQRISASGVKWCGTEWCRECDN